MCGDFLVRKRPPPTGVSTVDMVHHTKDSLYPTTNIPPLTTHLALNVGGALRYQCLCDDDRDGKEDDCSPDMIFTSDQCSWKQCQKATILAVKRQKPLANVLGGLHLPCVDCMI